MSNPVYVPNWRLNIERNRELTDELGCSPAAYLIGVNGYFKKAQPTEEPIHFAQRQFTIVCDFSGEPKAEFKRDYSRARFLLRLAQISEGKSIRYSEAIPTTKEEYNQFYDDFLALFEQEVDSPSSLTEVERKTLDIATDICTWLERAWGIDDTFVIDDSPEIKETLSQGVSESKPLEVIA